MDVQDLNNMTWFGPLVEDVRQALAKMNEQGRNHRPALEYEQQELQERCRGWSQTLAKPNLHPTLREKIEAEYGAALERQQDIDTQLVESEVQGQRLEGLFEPQAVIDRLQRLDQVLAESNPTLGNLELAMHIDRIDVFKDGRVVLRTCKLGVLGDTSQLLSDCEADESVHRTDSSERQAKPRRRARLRTEGADGDSDELKNAAFFAADPYRFAGLGDQWFWIDEFTIPEASFWAADNAEAVFRRRQETHWSYAKLAVEFGVTPPTIGAAIRHYLKAHPGERDEVQLKRGGKRRPKFDLSQFADEARQLWIEGWSKEKLAKKYGCSAPTVGKAIAYAYAQEGLPMPTREEARRSKVMEARRLLDAGEPLEQVAAKMKVSDVTARQFLRDSFAAEGKPMPDLRRRKGV